MSILPDPPLGSPRSLQTAVLPPEAAKPQPAASGRRTFRSFVEAMDDFGGDRRDVAGMRQMLAMQQANQTAAAQQVKAPAASAFAPSPSQPDVPVVQGPARATAPSPGDLPHLPDMPSPSAGNQVSGLPDGLPGLPQVSPSAGKVVAFIPAAPQPAPLAASTPAPVEAQSLPAQLRSPLVDQMRQATRSGARPGLSDETLARFSAQAGQRHTLNAPMPPRLMAQESRWNRDAWPASVSTARNAAIPTAAATAAVPTTAATQSASDLPRLPTFTAIE